MFNTIQPIRVGAALQHGALSVFPLFRDSSAGVEYLLADEAIAAESVIIKEIDEDGSVPELVVENRGDVRVLLIEGEELVGAKQNRILNCSVLVAAGASTKIPVSCVEQGRWRYKSRSFGSSGSSSPHALRYALKSSVASSLKSARGHESDQGKIWRHVAKLNAAHGVVSGTSAMSDTFDNYEEQLSKFSEELRYVDGAAGVVVAIGDKIRTVDLFDKASTCERVWDRLLSAAFLDAVVAEPGTQSPSQDDVESVLASTVDLDWQPSATVGEGDEFRAESPQHDHASVLVMEEELIHGSVLLDSSADE